MGGVAPQGAVLAAPDQRAGQSSRRLRIAIMSVIVGVAAVLRWLMIGRSSLWIDEGASVTLARMPWDRFLHVLWQYEANMTAYYLILRAWMHMGDSETIIRSLSALLGTAAVLAIYVLGRRVMSERVGVLAAALLAVNMQHLWYSQEARGYSLVVLMVIGSLLFFVEAVESPGKRWMWIGYVATSVLAVYSHVFALLVLAAQWLAVGPRRLRQIGVRRLGYVGVALALPLAPLVAFVLRPDRGQLEWIPPISVGGVTATLLATCGFNPLMLVLVLIGLGWSLKNLIRTDDEAFRMRLLALTFCVPVFVIAVASFLRPLLFFRHFAICIPPAAVVAARVLSPAHRPAKIRRAAVATLVALTLGFSSLVTWSYYAYMESWGGDWRSVTEYVLANRQAGDALLFHISAGQDAYRYYESRVPSSRTQMPLPTVIFPEAGDLASVHLRPDGDRLRRASAGHPRLWAVLHQKDGEDLPAALLACCRKVGEETFGGDRQGMGVKVQLYEIQ